MSPHPFTSTELHELWLRYHSDKLGLSGLTASSFLSWDEYLARESRSRDIEQRWLAHQQPNMQHPANPLASGLNMSSISTATSNMSPVAPILPISPIERVTVEAKHGVTCCGCVD